jgi:hypothetical protein
MLKYTAKDKNLLDREHLKIYQRGWLHLLPSILIYGEDAEGRWSKISCIEIAWLYWEMEIYFY